MRTEVHEEEVFPGHWYDSNDMNHVWNRMGSDPIQYQEWVLFPFLFFRPNIYSRLGYKYLESILTFVIKHYPKKVQGVMDLCQPATTTESRALIGMVQYYR